MKKLCLLGFIFLTLVSSAISVEVMKSPERGFISTRPAENWEKALISGNGTIGAL